MRSVRGLLEADTEYEYRIQDNIVRINLAPGQVRPRYSGASLPLTCGVRLARTEPEPRLPHHSVMILLQNRRACEDLFFSSFA
jgi:hypothetical protein